MKPTKKSDGLIMYCAQNNHQHGQFIALIFHRQQLRFIFDIGSGVTQLVLNKTLDFGKWYDVMILKRKNSVLMILNSQFFVSQILSKISLRSPKLKTLVYVGGVDNDKVSVGLNVMTNSSFQGCVRLVNFFINIKIKLLKLELVRKLTNFSRSVCIMQHFFLFQVQIASKSDIHYHQFRQWVIWSREIAPKHKMYNRKLINYTKNFIILVFLFYCLLNYNEQLNCINLTSTLPY